MNSIKVKKEIFDNIKETKINTIISENKNLKNEEEIVIQEEMTGNEIFAHITAKNIFNTLEDALTVIPSELFGDITLYHGVKGKIATYRIKVDTDMKIENLIKDNKIYEIIDLFSTEEIKVGRSTSKVFKTKLKKNNEEAIIKVQYLPSRSSLKEEYERLTWLQDKINSPHVYYWNEKNDYKYLIMEYKKGIPAFKYNDIGYQLGVELKKIHNVDISQCQFNNNSIEKLLSNCLEKIKSIFPEIKKIYRDETINSIVKFLNKNKPKDQVLIHGDYSLPNILIDGETYNFIDLGDASISTKYFDFYYFYRSLKINKKEYMMNEFLKGYGIEKIDYNYIKWMDIIDKSLY